jgi:23S rRNA (uracil1939-C5)-methyltransferase
LTFHISARSFFQVNTEQAEVLYNKALEYAALTGKETVIDAYCGTGTISLFLAQRARRVYGIEIVAPAIRDAEKNARDNHIRNAEFIVGDATAVMPRLYKEGIRPDVIVVDPPRAGCTPVVLETIARMNPTRIVYVSCNPASLARDLKILEDLGYKAKEAQPVDMFPQTSHVETVARIEKISGK